MRYSLGPAFGDIITQPSIVFDRIKTNELKAWSALILILVSSLVVIGWYFMTTDILRYLVESSIQAGKELTDEQLDAIRGQESMIQVSSIVSVGVSQLVMLLLIALYLFLVATIAAEERITYGQWVSLSAWAGLPTLLGLISMAVTYAMSSESYVNLLELNKTSLNNLLLHLNADQAGFSVANSLSLGGIWSWVLYALGYNHITNSHTATGFSIIAVPILIIYSVIFML